MSWRHQPEDRKEERGITFERADDSPQAGNSEQPEAEPASKLRDLRPEKDPMGARNKRASQKGR